MPRQANGVDRLEKEVREERQKLVPAAEAQPIPAMIGARWRSTPMSIAGMLNDLARPEAIHAIVFLFLQNILGRSENGCYLGKAKRYWASIGSIVTIKERLYIFVTIFKFTKVIKCS